MMDSNGKILVVIAVLGLILTGIYVYLFLIDRKVSRLEKEFEEKLSERKQ